MIKKTKPGPGLSKRAMPAGRPFQKGEDPRRHKLGRMSLDRAAFAARLNNCLCNGIGTPEDLARVLWRYAKKGEAWAVQELLERICGKVAFLMQVEQPFQRFEVIYSGAIVYPDGRREYPDGRIVHPDGRVTLPSGKTVYPNPEAETRAKLRDENPALEPQP